MRASATPALVILAALVCLLAAPASPADAARPSSPAPTSPGAPALLAPQADLARKLATAPHLDIEELGQPVKTIRQGMLLKAPNPDGKTWDLLQIYFPKYGGPNSIVIIDGATGRTRRIDTPAGWNFHLCPSVIAPNGKLFISILTGRLRQKICIYDPATRELKIDAVKMPEEILGETHPLVLGTDGKIYAIGQHPTRAAAAVQIDPQTLEAKLYGPIGPTHAPSDCWGYSGAADDRFIYVASGKVPWYLVAYDRQTGQSTVLAETDTVGGMVSVSQRPDGCIGSASGVLKTDGQRREYWLHEGKALPRDKAPNAPAPWAAKKAAPALPPLPPLPEINTSRAVPDLEGWAEIWVRPAEKKAAAPKDPPADASPEALGFTRYRFQLPLYPHPIYRLFELPDGRLMGTAGAYEGNFIFDPQAGGGDGGKHLGKIGLSHYATAISGGKVYMSGYPTSPLYEFDPARPWTAGTVVHNKVIEDTDARANPRQLLLMGKKELAGTHKMYAAATAANGAVYFGGTWIRDGSCGGVAWYDPKTGKSGGFWKPISNYQVSHMAAADEGRLIVLSTKRVEDSVLKKAKPAQGAMLILDAATNEIAGQVEPVADAKGTGPIVCAGGSDILGWTADPQDETKSILYRVDARAKKVIWTRPIPFALPVAVASNQQEAWDFRAGPDGKVWSFVNNVLVKIDPASGELTAVGKINTGGRIGFAQGRVYLGGTTALRRIKGLTAN